MRFSIITVYNNVILKFRSNSWINEFQRSAKFTFVICVMWHKMSLDVEWCYTNMMKSWGWALASSGQYGASWARFINWGHFPIIKHWCHLPFANKMRSSSISQFIEVVLRFIKVDVIFHVPKTLRLPSICPHIQVIFHRPRYWDIGPPICQVAKIMQEDSGNLFEKLKPMADFPRNDDVLQLSMLLHKYWRWGKVCHMSVLIYGATRHNIAM